MHVGCEVQSRQCTTWFAEHVNHHEQLTNRTTNEEKEHELSEIGKEQESIGSVSNRHWDELETYHIYSTAMKNSFQKISWNAYQKCQN